MAGVGAGNLFFAQAQLQAGGLTDIQRAARFFYLLKTSFGCDKRTFATSSKGVQGTLKYLEAVQQRLKGVVIENRDFEPIIKTYDRADALFYLDPPYLGTERYYEGVFGWEDHLRLAHCLRQIKGRFVLSYNDDPRIRGLYDWCTVEGVKRKEVLSSNGQNKQDYAGIIVRNFQ